MKNIQKKILSVAIAFLLVSTLYTGIPITAYAASGTTTVYITKTGNKYHSDGCRYLSRSCYAISLEDAVEEGYTACSVCNPPALTQSSANTASSPAIASSLPASSSAADSQKSTLVSGKSSEDAKTVVPATFDSKFYAALYPDVAKAVGSSPAALYNHYEKSGIKENRMPNCMGSLDITKSFDATWYAAKYKDVAKAIGTDPNKLYQHYVLTGFYEKRLPNANAANTMKALWDKLSL